MKRVGGGSGEVVCSGKSSQSSLCPHSITQQAPLSLSHLFMQSWSDLRPEGAWVSVGAQGGQAPEEITLGLAFFPLALALSAWPAKLPAQPSCSPWGWCVLALRTNPHQGKECHLPLQGHCRMGREQSPARPGQLCHSNWKCSLWEQLGACCKGGVLQCTPTPQQLFP